MKSMKSILRKSAKKKAQRKDYTKKRNVLRNNVKQSKFHILTAGNGILPKNRKVTKSRKVTASVH